MTDTEATHAATKATAPLTLEDVRTHAAWAGSVYHDRADGVLVGSRLYWLDGNELFATDQDSTECIPVETEPDLERLVK